MECNAKRDRFLLVHKLPKVEDKDNNVKEMESVANYLQRIGDKITTNYENQQQNQWWHYMIDILNI